MGAVCPNGNEIKPCTCDDEGLRCSHPALKDLELVKVFEAKAERRALRNVWIFQTNITALAKRTFGSYIIKHLYLDLNKIQRVESDAFGDATSRLITLSLARNFLTLFPFGDLERMKKLKKFGLAYNKINTLPQNAFTHCTELEHLDLSHNSIADVEPYTFANLHSIEIIDLSGNRLQKLRTQSMLVQSKSRISVSKINLTHLI